MLRNLTSFYLVILLMGCASKSSAQSITLISGSKTDYKIILPDKASKAEIKAAETLKKYLKLVCFAEINIQKELAGKIEKGVFIGKTEAGSIFYQNGRIKDDGFCIASDNANLFIVGAHGQGSLYGVYDFLERYMGCRKYDAGPVSFKTLTKLDVPTQLNDIQNPAFVYRQSYYPMSNDAEYLNWHKLQKFDDLWGIWGHSFFKLLSPDEFFKPHPEYFSLLNEKRQPRQLCLSNQQVFELVKARLKKRIESNPDAMYWSISQMDGDGYCTCAECAKADAEEGGPQGSLIRFVNRIAKAFPGQQFTTLAYGYSANAPTKTNPARNVTVLLSNIDAYRQKPLIEEPSAANFRSQLNSWKQITDNIFVWDYTTQFTHYLTPFPDYDAFKPNLSYLKKNSVNGVFMQGSGDTYGDAAELNSYLQAKLLWDPYADIEAVKADFLTGYYQQSAPVAASYFDDLTTSKTQTYARLDIYGNPANDMKSYLSPQFLAKQVQAISSAENNAKNSPELLARLERLKLSPEYAALQQAKVLADKPGGYRQQNGQPINGFSQRVNTFVSQAKTAGVTELSEGGATPDAYLTEWNILLKRPLQKSLAHGSLVSLLNPFSEDYPANKEKTLTDGVYGGLDYSYNWLFFYGTDMVATLDLQSKKNIREINLNFLNDPKHYIFEPANVEIEVSADGKNYQPYFTGKNLSPAETDQAVIKTISAAKPVKARFIKISAKCLSKLPAWIFSNTRKPALCCDEVLVL